MDEKESSDTASPTGTQLPLVLVTTGLTADVLLPIWTAFSSRIQASGPRMGQLLKAEIISTLRKGRGKQEHAVPLSF